MEQVPLKIHLLNVQEDADKEMRAYYRRGNEETVRTAQLEMNAVKNQLYFVDNGNIYFIDDLTK
jgi:hypothetical protein